MSGYLNSGLNKEEYFQCAEKYNDNVLRRMSDEDEVAFQNKVLKKKLKDFIKNGEKDGGLYSGLKFIISLMDYIDEENSVLLSSLNDKVLDEICCNY